jgi:DNA-binding response OmpR family regulator
METVSTASARTHGVNRAMTGEEILIIEDDSDVAALLKAELMKHHYHARVVSDGLTGMADAQRRPPALVILDLMLPVLSGWEVCRSLKPALTNEEDRVRGLELGADDYLTKPFGLKELLARIRALLRRERPPDGEAAPATVQAGPLTIDSDRHEASLSGRPLKLTPIEFALLTCLARQPGKVFTRDQLITALWGEDRFVEEHNLDVHIHALRQQLEPDSPRPRFLLTVRGVGYKLQITGKSR